MTGSQADSPQFVRTLNLEGVLRKWRDTLSLARRRAPASPSRAKQLGIRLAALAPIRKPIFILGCPRSGTTYLGELLSSLPRVSYYFEPRLFKYYSRLVYERKVGRVHAHWVYKFGLRTLLLFAPGRGPRIVEKNPVHTWIAEALYEMFPDAQFVMIVRDGRDTALSLIKKRWHLASSKDSREREPGEYLYGPYPHFYIENGRAAEYEATSDFHRCIWIWRRFSEEMLRLKKVLPASAQHHLRYEDLVGDTKPTLISLLKFLGEDDEKSVEAVMLAATRGHQTSIKRWTRELDENQSSIIKEDAGALLRDLGYT